MDQPSAKDAKVGLIKESDEHVQLKKEVESHKDDMKALLLSFFAQISSVIMNTLRSHTLSLGIRVTDFLVLSAFASVFLCIPQLFVFGKNPVSDVPSNMVKLVGIRSILGSIAMGFYHLAFLWMPMSHIIVIFNLYPIVASIFAYFINKEPILRVEILAFFLCFIGIILFAVAKSLDTEVE
jgi:drug/metabolite transporter (DMT)-like permease